MASLDFTLFDDQFRSFAQFWRLRWEAVQHRWESAALLELKRRAAMDVLPFEVATARLMTPQLVFLNFIAHAAQVREGAVDFTYLQEVWRHFRLAFTPQFPTLDEMLASASAASDLQADLREVFLEFGLRYSGMPGGADIRRISYAAFTNTELSYLKENHPRLVEVGCGRGYALARYRAFCGDGIAIENRERALHLDPVGRAYSGWRSLVKAGAIVYGDGTEAARYPDRSLGIFFGEPGAAVSHQALTAYRTAGGKHFLWKPGGIFGVRVDTQGSMTVRSDRVQNIFSFAVELGTHWRQIPAPLGLDWNELMMEEGMLVFERR